MTTFLDGFYKAKDTWFPVMKVTPNTVTRANDCFRWRMGSSAARTRQGQSTPSRSNTEILVGEVGERPVTALSLVGEAYPDVKEESGGDRYNVKLVFTLPQKEGEEGGAQVKISFRKLEPSDSLYRCRTL